MGKKEAAEEDLAVQDTLSMTIEARIELLAALIVDRIADDQRAGGLVYERITGLAHG